MEDSLLDSADLAVISPGVPIDSPVVVKFNEKNIPVWGEIELAYNYERALLRQSPERTERQQQQLS